MEVDLVISSRWVIPVEPDNTVLEYHSVAVRDGNIVEGKNRADLLFLSRRFYPPWTQPRQAKKNSESEPPVEANITIVIFRVRLALGIF